MTVVLLVILISSFPVLFSGLGKLVLSTKYLNLEMALDYKGGVFFITVSLISFFVMNWSMYYMSSVYKQSLFYFTLLMFVLSMLVLIISDSLLLIFLGWEGLGVTSFLLIVFYQNWLSGKGGLLTLLTNRLGDGVFLVTFCSWVAGSFSTVSSLPSSFFVILLMVVTFTKSAQWPFSSWLPAAMAAPTPVSALVHSSTLVTAGLWLLIRFGSSLSISSVSIGLLGLLTLLMASMAALLENDAKKVVALSTLSQLGLMFLSLSISATTICLAHIITHALAKANLFMIIGSLLHSSFSEQDTRSMFSSSSKVMLVTTSLISLSSLSGFTFTSIFFSKELILTSGYFGLNGLVSMAGILLISSLTFSYCAKLFFSISSTSVFSNLQSFYTSMFQYFPIVVLSIGSLLVGIFFLMNLTPCSFDLLSLEGAYWSFLVLGVGGLVLLSSSFLLLGFSFHSKFIDIMLSFLSPLKKEAQSIEASMSESLVLLTSTTMGNFFVYSHRVVLILILLMLAIVLT